MITQPTVVQSLTGWHLLQVAHFLSQTPEPHLFNVIPLLTHARVYLDLALLISACWQNQLVDKIVSARWRNLVFVASLRTHTHTHTSTTPTPLLWRTLARKHTWHQSDRGQRKASSTMTWNAPLESIQLVKTNVHLRPWLLGPTTVFITKKYITPVLSMPVLFLPFHIVPWLVTRQQWMSDSTAPTEWSPVPIKTTSKVKNKQLAALSTVIIKIYPSVPIGMANRIGRYPI